MTIRNVDLELRMSIEGVIKASTTGVGEMYRHCYVGRYPPLEQNTAQKWIGDSDLEMETVF
jgi:hypothetical protein